MERIKRSRPALAVPASVNLRSVENIPDSGTVTVASKMPNGVILQLFQQTPIREAAPGGSRDAMRSLKVGEPVKLNKARIDDLIRAGVMPEYKIIGGYALTENVPASFWNEWCKQNYDSPLLKNKVIFAFAHEPNAVAAAREHAGVRSGLEPIRVDRDPRMPKDIRKADKTDSDMKVD